MKYRITIEEIISKGFEVEADNMENALIIAERNYKNAIFSLEPGNLICKQICAESFDGKDSVDWYEF